MNPASPYGALLNLAGCEYGDLEKLVLREGIEQSLEYLYRRGVYLTVDEFKGNRAVVRGSSKFHISPDHFVDPRAIGDIVGRTGGSRGPGTPVSFAFESLRDRAIELFLSLEASGGLDWSHAIWGMPGSGDLRYMIGYSLCNALPARWFSLVDATAPKLHPRYAWSVRSLRCAGHLAGLQIPRPINVSAQDPLPVLRWMTEVLRSARTPHLVASPSSAVSLCSIALDAGISLRGAQFTLGGEPITPARLAVIERAGAAARINYGTAETGSLGRGCMSPLIADEIHFVDDCFAAIQPGEAHGPDLPVQAILLTTLLPRTRLIMLNVSTGDQATISRRQCACPLHNLGWTTHLHTIRSFEKLTARGVTFMDADVIHVLEEVLPKNFGGGPTDYQIVDSETEDGAPRLRLLVHPRLGALDADAVRQCFLEAIGAGSGVEQVMTSVWRDAGLPIVGREAPIITTGGKILHVHRIVPADENIAAGAKPARTL